MYVCVRVCACVCVRPTLALGPEEGAGGEWGRQSGTHPGLTISSEE